MQTRASIFVLSLLVAAAVPAQAQSDTRFLPWLGCWEPVPGGAPARQVCVVAAAEPTAVDLVTMVDGNVIARERVDVSGESRDVSQDGCRGTERGTWSADGLRIFRSAELACEGGLRQTVTEIMTVVSGGQWLNVQGVVVEGESGARVQRYVPVAREQGGAVPAPTTADIIEASRLAQALVVRTWLTELGGTYELDGRRLAGLARAGVPGEVTDAMIALSYPTVFGSAGARAAPAALPGLGAFGATTVSAAPYPESESRYAASYACMAARSRFLVRDDWCSGSPYFYARYGLYYQPFEFAPQSVGTTSGGGVAAAPSHGTVVKGRGYVPGPGSATASTGQPRPGSSDRVDGGSTTSAAGGAGAAGASSSTGTQSSGGRTAKARP